MDLKDTNMVSIAIDDLFVNTPTDNNIYIKLSPNRYVTLYKKGTVPDLDHLQKYKQKDIQQLWVEHSALYDFVKKNVYLARLASRSQHVAPEKKAKLFSKATNTVFKHIHHSGLNSESFEETKNLAQSFFKYAMDLHSVSTMVDALNTYDDWVIRRSVMVAYLSLIIGLEMDDIGPLQLHHLTVGGLLHDIGLTKLPVDLTRKPYDDMTDEEMAKYKTHPELGRILVSKYGEIHPEVVDIVHQHHERPSGKGYPSGLQKSQIHLLTQIVATADEFSDLVLQAPHRPRVLPVPLAIHTYLDNNEFPINRSISRALKEALKKRQQ